MEWMLMPFSRYAEFSGRSRRKEFWMFFLLNTFVMVALLVLIAPSRSTFASSSGFSALGIVGLVLWVIATFIPNLAVQVRRFHDQDRSGWWVLLGLIPYVGGLIILGSMLLEGTVGTNQYGPDPKDRSEGQLGLST